MRQTIEAIDLMFVCASRSHEEKKIGVHSAVPGVPAGAEERWVSGQFWLFLRLRQTAAEIRSIKTSKNFFAEYPQEICTFSEKNLVSSEKECIL